MPEWTQEQKSAIEDRGGTLLVSAAAGSGKTAVLTERVLRRVTDPENPIDITELLLVTFTRAAAAEMRERIAAAIGAAVAQDPSSVRLRRQLFLVHRAKITTVHALCMSLAREQAAALGIAPDFRLMDENESKILRAEVLEEVLETAYERADEKFLALSDLLTAGRDDRRLGEVILGTYDKIQAHPDPRAFLEDVRAGLYARGMDTPHGRVLMEQAKAAALHGMAFLETAIGEVTGMLGISVYILADTYFISVYSGADGLAVLNLILPVYGLIYAIGAMIGIGSATRYAIDRARGKSASFYFLSAVTWDILISIPLVLAGIFIPDKILQLLGADAGLTALGKQYLRIILAASPFFMSNYAFTAFARNDSAPAIAMLGSIAQTICEYLEVDASTLDGKSVWQEIRA